jgi:hypothetical protein
MIPLIGWNWGHNGAIVVCGVDLWHVYHWKYHIPTLYYTCLCPNGMLVYWDKVLHWLQCHHHLLCECVEGEDEREEGDEGGGGVELWEGRGGEVGENGG